MEKILVTKLEEFLFEVKVGEGAEATTHKVFVPKGYLESFGIAQDKAEEVVRKSFEFLLKRESKGSILKEFELPLIQKYFPEYETGLPNIL